MKKLFVWIMVVLLVAVAWNSALAAKPEKPPKADKAEIVHSGGHDGEQNPHQINVSCRARGHRGELGDAYCGKEKRAPGDAATSTSTSSPGNTSDDNKRLKIDPLTSAPVIEARQGVEFHGACAPGGARPCANSD